MILSLRFLLELSCLFSSIACNLEPMAIFACFGVLALIVALMLKAEDKKKGYGLQEANIKK